MASDLAGHNDTAVVGIYILRDDQRVKIIINEIPDKVRQFEEEFISLLSNITGAIVNTDDVQVTVGDGAGWKIHFFSHKALIGSRSCCNMSFSGGNALKVLSHRIMPANIM